MKIFPVSKDDYVKILKPQMFYDSADFNELNSYKTESLVYMLANDSKYRFGVCFGKKNNTLSIPFSAPFGLIEPVKNEWKVEQLEETIQAIDKYAQENSIVSIHIVLPPNFYNQDLITATQNILFRNGYTIDYIEMNYSINLTKLDKSNYINNLPRNGRKNTNISLRAGLVLEHCESFEKKQEAYRIIQINRESKGYPLRMTWEQVYDTLQLVQHDFWIVRLGELGIAAAQVFMPMTGVAQVIYWGDCPGYGEYKPMNYLPYMLIQHYSERGVKFLDIGPASEKGIPSYGLCDYKTSIGCEIFTKIAFFKEYK